MKAGEAHGVARFTLAGSVTLAYLMLLIVASAGAQDFDRTIPLRLAAMQLMREDAAALEKAEQAPFIRAAEDEMLADVKAHSAAARAEQLVRQGITRQLQARIDAQLTTIYAELKLGENGVTQEMLRKEVTDTLGSVIRNAEAKYIEQNARPIFTAARAAAVDEQTKQLAKAAHPSGEEVFRSDSAGFTEQQQQALRQSIVARIEKNLPAVFDEVDAAVRSSADDVLKDIGAQRAMQLGLAQAPIPPALITRGQMTRYLGAQAAAALDMARKNQTANRTVYDLLPSARSRIEAQAALEENKRLGEFLVALRVSVDADAIRSAISANPRSHRDRAVSEGVFAQQYFDPAVRQAVQTRVTQAADAPDLDEFRARVTTALTQSSPMHDELLKSIKASLAPALRKARDAVASDQLSSFFPALADRSWEPPEKVLYDIEQGKLAVHDFDGASQLPQIAAGGHAYQRDELLAETQTLVQEQTGQLLQEGRRAWQMQAKLVEDLTDPIKQELQKVTELSPDSEAGWVQHFTEQANGDWEKQRPSLWRGVSQPPDNAGGKYVSLFGPMREQIRRMVHAEFQATKLRIETQMQAQQPAAQMPHSAPAAPSQSATTASTSKGANNKVGAGGSGSNQGAGTGTGAGARGGGGEGEGSGKGMLVRFPWLWLLLLLLVLLLLLILLFYLARWLVLYLRGRSATRSGGTSNRWRDLLARRMIIQVTSIPKITEAFGAVSAIRPTRVSTTEAVYRVGLLKLTFIRAVPTEATHA
jgi:hypothetical protein